MSQPPMPSLPHQVVRASAGAGKTYQLTTRYLDLLVRREAPQQILATTFTRKAAGEVLARVLGRLAWACANDADQQQLASALNMPGLSRSDCIAMLRVMTDALNRLSVGTIDSFFNRAARALAMDLGLPAEPRLIDEGSPLAQQMRSDAIQAVLGEQAGNDEGLVTLIELLRRLHHDTAQRSVTQAIDAIVKDLGDVYRSYPDRALWDQLPSSGLLTNELLAAVVEQLDAMRGALPVTGKGEPHKAFAKVYENLLADAQLGHWDSVLSNGLVVKVNEEAGTYARAPIDDHWRSAIYPLAVHAKSVRLRALADQTLATYDLLAWFDRHYQATRYAQRVLLFSDLTHVLAEGLPAMGEAGIDELSYRLDTKVTHLLLDEFQDTSLSQWKVLGPFAELITDNFEDNRSLFCVGDTKQAIYGWRGGCAELFDAVEALPGVEPTTLSDSYRSSQVVLDAVNEVFTSLAGNAALSECQSAAQQWQDGFELHYAVKQALPGHAVLHTTAHDEATGNDNDNDHDDDAAAPPDAHAHYVAGYIQSLLKIMPGQTIGVLMRSRANARTLVYALRSLGVPATEEGGNPIGHNPAVAAVLAAIQFADHPGDSVARFHVTNSPMGEVLGLDQGKHPESVARDIRRSLMDEGYAAVIGQWVERLAPSCDAASLARLIQLLVLAEQYDSDGATLRPSFFVRSAQAAKVEDASPAPVRVMTIHASKGLEFDAVVLPDLDGTLSTQDQRDLIVLDRDSPIEPVRGVYRRLPSKLTGLTPALEQAHAQRTHEKRVEDLCLLYVAMTRARQGLHMLVRPLKPNAKGKAGSKGLTNLSYAAVLRQALRTRDDEGFDGDACLYELGSPAWASGAAEKTDEATQPTPAIAIFKPIKLQKIGKGQSRSWVKASPSQMHNQSQIKGRDLLDIEPNGGQRYGSVVHAMLQRVGFLDEDVPSVDVLRQAGASIGGSAIDRGIDLDATANALHHALAKPAAQSLLQRNGADVLWRERRFMTRLSDRLVTGSFDRVHLWHDNGKPTRALLIDYKTDRVDDASLHATVVRYADQLGLYRQALTAMLGLDAKQIDAKLYFVGDDVVADVVV